VSESGRHLGEIVAAVKKVSDVVGEISNASQEQAASAEEISRAVLQMDEGTQQNAAMVEEASAAAASMQDQASRLSELTAFFRLTEQPGARAALEPNGLEPAASSASAATGAGAVPPVGTHRHAGRSGARALDSGSRVPAHLPARAAAPSVRERAEGVRREGMSEGMHEPQLPPASVGDWSEF
jgi:hypothetical protein